MTSTELVHLPTVYFRRGWRREQAKVGYLVPKDTLDLRYRLCTDHRVACDCREAELAEQIAELRYVARQIEKSARENLAGHYLYDYGDNLIRCALPEGSPQRAAYYRGNGPLACQCTGCRIVRASDVYVATDDNGLVRAEGRDS